MAGFWIGEASGVGEGMEWDDAGVEEEGEFERRSGFEETHGVGAAVGGFVAGFEGAGFNEREDVHGEFFEVFREDELSRGVGAGGCAAVAREDVDGLFGEGVADIFEGAFGHAGGSFNGQHPGQRWVRRLARKTRLTFFGNHAKYRILINVSHDIW